MYSSRRRLYLSSRRCPAPVISRLAIGSPAPGRSRPAGSSTNEQTRIPRSRCTWRGTAAAPRRHAARPRTAASWRPPSGAALPRSIPVPPPGRHRPHGTAMRPGARAARRARPRMRPRGSRPPRRADRRGRPPACGARLPRRLPHRCSVPATWPGAAPRPRSGPRVSGQPAAAYRSCVPVSPVAMNYGTGAPGLRLAGRAAAQLAPGHHSTRPGPVAGRRVTLTARPHTPRAPGRTAAPGLDSSGHGVRRG